MASIITATTSSGLTQSADNSGVLQLASGTGNLVTIPSVTGTLLVSGNQPAFSVYSNVSQALSVATQTKVIFQVEEFDTNNNFASSRFTPTVAGYYQINGATTMTGTGVTRLFTSIFKNGSEYKRGNDLLVTGYQANVSSLVFCNGSTDYIELFCWINGSSGLSTSPSEREVYLNGVLVRAA